MSWLRRFSVALLLAAGVIAGIALLERGGGAAPPEAAAVVPFELLESNHMLVRAKINGKGPYQFIFDLGSPIVLLNNRVAEDSGAIKPDAPRSFLFGARGEAEADELQLGDLKAKNVPVIVMDHPALKVISRAFKRPIDGIVGYTFFARYKTTIDYQSLKMTFTPVQFEVRNLMQELPNRLFGPKVARERVLAPGGLWGLKVQGPTDPSAGGVTVAEVLADSPAAAAGMRKGDVLLSIDGRWTTSVSDTFSAASTVPAGRAVPVVVERSGQEITILVRPAEGI
jgi:hypothetical protein